MELQRDAEAWIAQVRAQPNMNLSRFYARASEIRSALNDSMHTAFSAILAEDRLGTGKRKRGDEPGTAIVVEDGLPGGVAPFSAEMLQAKLVRASTDLHILFGGLPP